MDKFAIKGLKNFFISNILEIIKLMRSKTNLRILYEHNNYIIFTKNILPLTFVNLHTIIEGKII
ncbi:hypothetical protein BMS3Abin04_01469 [bacterium BMS3Abin04]|nr:hypothetical protein BMS3Abin04_01469 [bacterium BMS3Abin04]